MASLAARLIDWAVHNLPRFAESCEPRDDPALRGADIALVASQTCRGGCVYQKTRLLAAVSVVAIQAAA